MNKIAIQECARLRREDFSIQENQKITDVESLIVGQGYHYHEDHFGNDFAGYSKYAGNNIFQIGFNKDAHWNDNFKRFTLSHELAHLSIPNHLQRIKSDRVHYSNPEFQSADEMEKEADYFAISFLAPQTPFRLEMMESEFTKETVASLAQSFKISVYSAAIRFIELTNLVCSLIAVDKSGKVLYESQSANMWTSFRKVKIPRGTEIKPTTYAYDRIVKKKNSEGGSLPLNEWYQDIASSETMANESIIELGYCNRYLVLITPAVTDFQEIDEDTDSF